MLSLEDVIDGHLSSIIVDMLGGPYLALSLRATSRKFRALIPAPEHTHSTRKILRISAMIGDIKRCARIIEAMDDEDYDMDYEDGDEDSEYSVIEDASIEAAKYGQLEVCQYLIHNNVWGNAPHLLNGAAQRGDLELCKSIIAWISTKKHQRYLAPSTTELFFEPMMKGAIISGHMGCFNLARSETVKPPFQPFDCSKLLGYVLEYGRVQMCRAIWDWSRVDGRNIRLEDGMLRAADSGQTAIFESMRTWAPYDARALAVGVMYCDHFAPYEIVRRTVREDLPREYVRIIYDMMIAAIQRANMRAFIAIYGWVIEARGGRPLTFEELRAPLIACATNMRADICAFLCDRASEAIIAQ